MQTLVGSTLRIQSLDKVKQKVQRIGGRYRGSLSLTDVRFHADQKALRLRKFRDWNIAARLMYRDEEHRDEIDSYRLWSVEVDDFEEAKGLLTNSLDVIGSVETKRQVYHYEDVIVHLDDVEGVGKFVQLTKESSQGTLEEDKEAVRDLLEELELSADVVVTNPYP